MSVNIRLDPQPEKIANEWPADALERVEQCPVCGSRERRLLYSGLTDRVFGCAPGHWDLYQCQGCRSAYLDPRPTLTTIGIAYSTYFTHKIHSKDDLKGLSWARRVRRALANGYRNHRIGTNYQPSIRLGVLAARLLPSQRLTIDAEIRDIPKAKSGDRLLDVGCGNGEFLALARLSGWDVVGVDFDPNAVTVARSRGLDVRQGSVEALDPAKERFDGITLSHVIEHVHDPLAVLRQCHALLKPGGWIWIETPNIDAQGHARYGANWRGLEPPRHLVLFSRDALFQALVEAGFQSIADPPYRPLCSAIFAASEAITDRSDSAFEATHLSQHARRSVRAAEREARRDPTKREFITVTARKPA